MCDQDDDINRKVCTSQNICVHDTKVQGRTLIQPVFYNTVPFCGL